MINSSDIFRGKILIVDDKGANVLLLSRILASAGYTSVVSTMDPSKVCELHLKNRYDLILLDIQMPGMDGFHVMEGLKTIEEAGYIPVLVITAHSDLKLSALRAGAKDFLSAPFDKAEVLARVYNMLEVRLLYKQISSCSRESEYLALHDALTGLPNRRLLMDRLSLAIVHARRNKRTMAVIYLDLDGFKQVNDTMGHDAGDTLLKMVADRLVAAVRQEDTVTRLGGDEFVIVLWELSHAAGVDKPVSKVIQSVSQAYNIEGHNVSITASAGVSIYPAHGEEVDMLLKSADLALHEAKRTGKNDYRIASAHRPFGNGAVDVTCPPSAAALCK